MPFKSIILVVIQFLLLGLLSATTNFNLNNFSPFIFLVISGVVLVWSICTMQKSTLRISPIPHAKATLVTTGPYTYIRHPMYTALITASIALLLFNYNLLRIVLFSLLIITLIIKLLYEENLLSKKFHEYNAYKKTTKHLVPFLW